MSKHTPEPWEFWENLDDDPVANLVVGPAELVPGTDGASIRAPIAECNSPDDADYNNAANGRRIVICVNALRGASNEAILFMEKRSARSIGDLVNQVYQEFNK